MLVIVEYFLSEIEAFDTSSFVDQARMCVHSVPAQPMVVQDRKAKFQHSGNYSHRAGACSWAKCAI